VCVSSFADDGGNDITGKHGYFVNIIKLSEIPTLEASPDICYEDLGALEESHCPALKLGLIAKDVEVLSQ
jgi:hypothetical protein